MKAAPFDYAAPTTVAEAVALLERGDDAVVLAGGQSLVPLLALRLATPDLVVDINRVAGLGEISRANGHVRVGALVRHAAFTKRGSAADAVPLLGLAAPHIGHFQIRNRGTLCGSLTHADAAAEWPLVATTLDAELELVSAAGVEAGAGARVLPRTVHDRERTRTSSPSRRTSPSGAAAPASRSRSSPAAAVTSRSPALPAASRSTAGMVTRCAIGLLGMAGRPLRAAAAERAVVGTAAEDLDLGDIGRLAIADLDPPADIHGSSHYRRRIGAVTVAAAVARAVEEARDE